MYGGGLMLFRQTCTVSSQWEYNPNRLLYRTTDDDDHVVTQSHEQRDRKQASI